jgi:hypothetical protein
MEATTAAGDLMEDKVEEDSDYSEDEVEKVADFHETAEVAADVSEKKGAELTARGDTSPPVLAMIAEVADASTKEEATDSLRLPRSSRPVTLSMEQGRERESRPTTTRQVHSNRVVALLLHYCHTVARLLLHCCYTDRAARPSRARLPFVLFCASPFSPCLASPLLERSFPCDPLTLISHTHS